MGGVTNIHPHSTAGLVPAALTAAPPLAALLTLRACRPPSPSPLQARLGVPTPCRPCLSLSPRMQEWGGSPTSTPIRPPVRCQQR